MKSGGPMFCALLFQSSVQCTNINFFTSFGFCLPKADRLNHKGETTCSLKKLRDRKTLQHNAVRNNPQQLRITKTLTLNLTVVYKAIWLPTAAYMYYSKWTQKNCLGRKVAYQNLQSQPLYWHKLLVSLKKVFTCNSAWSSFSHSGISSWVSERNMTDSINFSFLTKFTLLWTTVFILWIKKSRQLTRGRWFCSFCWIWLIVLISFWFLFHSNLPQVIVTEFYM